MFLASVAVCNKILAFLPSLIIQWIKSDEFGDHSLLATNRRFDLVKLENGNVKNDGYS